MTASVPREKKDGSAREFAPDDDIAGGTPRGVDAEFGGVGEAFDLVKAAAADDPDVRILHVSEN